MPEWSNGAVSKFYTQCFGRCRFVRLRAEKPTFLRKSCVHVCHRLCRCCFVRDQFVTLPPLGTPTIGFFSAAGNRSPGWAWAGVGSPAPGFLGPDSTSKRDPAPNFSEAKGRFQVRRFGRFVPKFSENKRAAYRPIPRPDRPSSRRRSGGRGDGGISLRLRLTCGALWGFPTCDPAP